jgi:ADP-ribose pyrophosphatase YjhB (NUDIX family)
MAKFISATLVVCRKQEGELLLVQEGKEHVHGRWDFPGGGLEHDESVKECAEREVKEETGFEVEATGFYDVHLEESDTTDLPVIVFLVDAGISGEGEADHHFEGEILDHGFFSREEIDSMKLRKDNREKLLEVIEEKDPLPIERLQDVR